MARAATDLDDAVPSRADAPRAETLQQGLAVAATAQPGVGETEQVGDGALDFVEAPARSEAVPAVVRPVRILHRDQPLGPLMPHLSHQGTRIRRPWLESRTAYAPCCGRRDRKSTRLNSSHSQISYAVFCLKKKNKNNNNVYN